MKILRLETPSHGHTATPEPKRLVRNIMGSLLIVVLAILAVSLLLLPKILDLLRQIFASPRESVALLAGLLLIAFLISLPLSWFFRSLLEYRTARMMDRTGIVSKGSLMDKWVEEENGRIAYYIRYTFAIHLNAMQKVDRETYEQLRQDDCLYILHLKGQPWISRLDVD